MASTSMMTMEADEAKVRDEQIGKIIAVAEIIIQECGELTAELTKDLGNGVIDLDISNKLSEILMIVFNCLRKEENDPVGYQKYLGYTRKLGGIEVSIQTVVEKIKAKKITLDFLVATPIVELMTLFEAMFNEVRTGMTNFKVMQRTLKRDSSGRAVESELAKNYITQYGLVNHHIPLLQGITIAPMRRMGVLESLGPLAQAILMVKEDKDTVQCTELTSALTTSLKILPRASEIISCLKEANSPGSVSGILTELGDILLITTTRFTQKIYFPLLLSMYMWKTKGNFAQWSFSGSSMIKFYNEKVLNVKFKICSGAPALMTTEVIFHSIFGTYLEDLSILPQITFHKEWHKRKDINTVFHRRSEKPKITCTPIRFEFVPKLEEVLLTKSLGNINSAQRRYGQITSRPVFAGMRRRFFTQEFFEYMTTGKSGISFSRDPLQLRYALKKIKDSLLEQKDSDKVLRAGTKRWETLKEGIWVETEFEPVKGNVNFFGF